MNTKQFLRIINYFTKKRDSFIGDNYLYSVFIYFGLLFIIDYSGIIDLYDQSIVRRTINMYRRLDPLNYEKKLKPYCVKYEKILNDDDILKLQSIKIPITNDVLTLTRRNTITHQCCDKYDESEKKIIQDISEKIRIIYENKVGKKLYYLESNKATIYVYKGDQSHHLWHVDPQNLSSIYNVIVCIRRKGNISPLQCKDTDNNEYSIEFQEGDAALFNGGTTVHQVPPNDDPESERVVLSIAFTDSEIISSNKNMSNNLCTYTEGGNNYFNIFKIWLIIFLINLSLTYISGANHLSYSFIGILAVVVMLTIKYIPYYFDIGLGTGRSASIYHSIMVYIFFILITFSFKGAVLFASYFALSDVFFYRKWVEYD